ncbi:MAG: glycosyltransferase family 39 protein [Candidatus Omnitrophica bacterium]|nr:glycosyltransferase family 39 protein [Candidatus Omnitrophota bacterium]MDD5552732.1 glycosyltransferase family 39 protein [Candidatus Omnitrophota bacterium]
MKKEPRIKAFLISALLSGAVLRLYKLGQESLWADESLFILFRSGPAGFWPSLKFMWDKLCREGLDISNYGYRVFSTFWSSFFEGEFMLRLPSVIFGILCIFLIYKVGKLFFGRRAGLASAFIIAMAPFHVYYSQEFRMYSLISLLTLLAVYSLWKFLHSGEYRYLWVYIISSAVNFYMHIATVFVLSAQVVFCIFWRKRFKYSFRQWATGLGIIAFLIMPGIIFTLIELARAGGLKQAASYIFVSTASEAISSRVPILCYTFKNMCIGYNAVRWVWITASLLFLGLFFLALVKVRQKEALYLCLSCFLFPILVMYSGRQMAYADRYLIPSSIFLYLIAGGGIACLQRNLTIMVLVPLFTLNCLALNNYYKGHLSAVKEEHIGIKEKPECRESARYIYENFQEGDVIFHTECNTVVPFRYYFNYRFNKTAGKNSRSFKQDEISLMLHWTLEGEMAAFKSWDKVGELLTKTDFPLKGHKRLWLVFASWDPFKIACMPGSKERIKLELLEKEYVRKEVKHFKNLTVYLLVNPNGQI